MKFENKVTMSDEQLQRISEGVDEGPIYMLNLLKFKDKAEYKDGRETNLSGKEAYAIYGKEVIKQLAKVGGSWTFGGNVKDITVGEIDELWDQVAIAMYPSRRAMFDMVMDKEYLEIHVHREAGLAGQLNIELRDYD
ncbi:MAG: DUF1330 domain-containing protein [Gammaproteobacteria bacterium]